MRVPRRPNDPPLPSTAGIPYTRGGLSLEQVEQQRRRYGPNLLPGPRAVPLWRRLLAQLLHFFAIMLWIAGGLAILARMPQLGFAIFVVIILNGVFAFIQEYRAEKAGERLRDLLPRRVTVRRQGGCESIDAVELVPGDVVVIGPGDRISADIRLEHVNGLAVDVSALTGESVPINPQAGEPVLAGTFAVEGDAIGVVTATARSTRLAAIAQLTGAKSRPATPLALELNRVVRVIAGICVAVGVTFLAIALLVGIHVTDAFVFALGVTVALVPEGLLPTVSLSLAMGAQRMAARGALVRRLESVETLGSTTFICTDKTGTLTRNEMSVAEVWMPGGWAFITGAGYEPFGTINAAPELLLPLKELAAAASLGVNGRSVLRERRWTAQGNPLDVALDVFDRRLNGNRAPLWNEDLVRRYPFDPRRRRLSVIVGNRAIVRGAPEAVFERCVSVGGCHDAVARMAEHGLRVVAIATREIDPANLPQSADATEASLTLLGLIGIEDPPRTGVADSIAACRRAGIRVAMVTGDHPATARAIAREVGLWRSDALLVEGKDLPADEDLLGALIDRDGMIVSRVSPEEKLRIARALRLRGHVVAMTGDGVNDAPALHEAAVGVAMGRSGTDVAREAADLLLLDDNFATIVAAIEQGRTTFANARRFLTYHLTDNVAELTPFIVWALSGGRFPLALGVLQVLCLDIGTDILPAVALGAEPPSQRVLLRQPVGRHLIDRDLLLRALILGLTESAVEMAAFLVTISAAGWRPGTSFPSGMPLLAASGAAFTAVVVGQMANAFACRSVTRWPGDLGWFSNRFLVVAVLCEAAMLAAFLYLRPLAYLLGQAPPNGGGYLVGGLAIPAVLAADVVYKRYKT